MTGFVRVCVLLVAGLALGIGYNAWPGAGGADYASADGNGTFDVVSYASGLVVGMMLWQIGSVPWSALPARLHQYLMSQMHFYQFAMMGAACLFVLIYF